MCPALCMFCCSPALNFFESILGAALDSHSISASTLEVRCLSHHLNGERAEYCFESAVSEERTH